MHKVIELLRGVRANNQLIFCIGNGGSATIASHLACDLVKMKNYRAFDLTTNYALITAIANDYGFAHIYSSQLVTLARRGDILLAFSASGTSPNIIKAIGCAKEHGVASVLISACLNRKTWSVSGHLVRVNAKTVQAAEDKFVTIAHQIIVKL